MKPSLKRNFSKSQVNKAGLLLIGHPKMFDFVWAMDVLSEWRSLHSYPINTFQATLRNKIRRLGISKGALVAQRLKRTPSILSKLKREKSMSLSRMQDIGGLRAVVPTMRAVKLLERDYKNSKFKHELVSIRDYINQPKSSGYRSVHLIYRYKSEVIDYDGLLLELQIRTKTQHAWATAVETMGTFLNQSLKSSQGSQEWLDFFSLTSSAFAYLEKTPPVHKYSHLSKNETYALVRKEARRLGVQRTLEGYSAATHFITRNKKIDNGYYLLTLDAVEKKIKIESFDRSKLDEATKRYAEVEKKIKDGIQMQAVLVSTGSIENLRKAYPNFFLDTQAFLSILNKVIFLSTLKVS